MSIISICTLDPKELKELLVAAEVGNIDKMRNVFIAAEQWGMARKWLTQSDIKGRTILHFAAIYGYLGVATFIVDKIIQATKDTDLTKEYLNMTDHKGRTPLFHAVAEGRFKVASLLVESGVDLEVPTNAKHYQPGSTALMACAEKNTSRCAELLIEHGADIFAIRKDGADAAYIASRYGHHTIVQQIVEADVRELVVNRPTFQGRTILLTAAFHGHVRVCKYLVKNGASIDHQDNNNYTALMYAASEGHLEIVKYLLISGANHRKRDVFGNTALKSAEENLHTDVVKYIKRWKEEEMSSRTSIDSSTKVEKGKSKRERGSYLPEKGILKNPSR